MTWIIHFLNINSDIISPWIIQAFKYLDFFCKIIMTTQTAHSDYIFQYSISDLFFFSDVKFNCIWWYICEVDGRRFLSPSLSLTLKHLWVLIQFSFFRLLLHNSLEKKETPKKILVAKVCLHGNFSDFQNLQLDEHIVAFESTLSVVINVHDFAFCSLNWSQQFPKNFYTLKSGTWQMPDTQFCMFLKKII